MEKIIVKENIDRASDEIIKRLMDGGKLGPHFFCERQIIKS